MERNKLTEENECLTIYPCKPIVIPDLHLIRKLSMLRIERKIKRLEKNIQPLHQCVHLIRS
jgi:uncharacterized membrane protein YciS (DUF1049 family)